MPVLVLTETSAGYALFKAKDKNLLEKGDGLAKEMSTAEGACSLYVHSNLHLQLLGDQFNVSHRKLIVIIAVIDLNSSNSQSLTAPPRL